MYTPHDPLSCYLYPPANRIRDGGMAGNPLTGLEALDRLDGR